MSCKFLSLRLASARHVIQNVAQHQHRKQCILNQNQAKRKGASFVIHLNFKNTCICNDKLNKFVYIFNDKYKYYILKLEVSFPLNYMSLVFYGILQTIISPL